MATTARPRRSVLFMPGSNARALEKARDLLADALIFDLEDAVAPDGKEKARQQVRAAQGNAAVAAGASASSSRRDITRPRLRGEITRIGSSPRRTGSAQT